MSDSTEKSTILLVTNAQKGTAALLKRLTQTEAKQQLDLTLPVKKTDSYIIALSKAFKPEPDFRGGIFSFALLKYS